MSDTTAEMKNVLRHLRKQLDSAAEIEARQSYPAVGVLTTLAYAQGVIDLLMAYLVVNEPDREIER